MLVSRPQHRKRAVRHRSDGGAWGAPSSALQAVLRPPTAGEPSRPRPALDRLSQASLVGCAGATGTIQLMSVRPPSSITRKPSVRMGHDAVPTRLFARAKALRPLRGGKVKGADNLGHAASEPDKLNQERHGDLLEKALWDGSQRLSSHHLGRACHTDGKLLTSASRADAGAHGLYLAIPNVLLSFRAAPRVIAQRLRLLGRVGSAFKGRSGRGGRLRLRCNCCGRG